MALPLSNATPLTFVDPKYPNLLLQVPTTLSTPFTTLTIVKDISGTAQPLPVTLQYNSCNQYGSTASYLAEPRGFIHAITYSNVTTVLESTHPQVQTGATIYTSSVFLSNSGTFSLNTDILQLQTFSTQTLNTESTITTNPTTSTLTLADTGTGTLSSIYLSNQNLYVGDTPIAPFVPTNFILQQIPNAPQWTPASLPGLQTWFDARDLSTMYVDEALTRNISTGEQFAVWLDKSSNLFSCVQTTLSNQPFYTDLSGVYFSTTTLMSTNFYAYSSMTFTMLTSPPTVGPYYFSNTTSYGGQLYFTNADTWTNYVAPDYTFVSGPAFYSSYAYNNGSSKMQLYMNDSGVPGRPNYNTTLYFDQEQTGQGINFPQTFDHYTILYDRVSTNKVWTRQNGHTDGQTSADDVVLNYQWWHMGDSRAPNDIWKGGPYGWRGDVIVYDRILTEPELQQLEGYLMWKYGIQKWFLPSHPYAVSPP